MADIKQLKKENEILLKGKKTLWKKEKMLVNQHFLIFPQFFQNVSS